MRLLRDLWATSSRRTLLVAVLVVVGAAGQAASLALAGAVLVDRSVPLFIVLACALVASVLTDVFVGLVAARLTADWAARVRRGLNRVAFGQDIPTLENTPVGELLDRIDSPHVGGMGGTPILRAASTCINTITQRPHVGRVTMAP